MTTGSQPGRILVAMSGGVDSSVAAALLVEEGHEVLGATMKTFCYGDDSGPTRSCCGLEGIQDARRVCDRLSIPHYVFDVEEDFSRDVVDDFVREYARGRTPNPCVQCNSNTKFRDLFRKGRLLGCDGVASGHYARIVRNSGGAVLARGVDRRKDQSYFLWGLPPKMLSKLHFPLGELFKPEVRARARGLGLETWDKPESQEICFVPTGDYRDFLRKKLPVAHASLSPGAIIDLDGRTLGRHDGYAGFVVGQRKGLGGGSKERRYVLEIRPATREVVVGPRRFLETRRARVEDLSWLAQPPESGEQVEAAFRYRAPPVRCRIERLDQSGATLRLDSPAAAISPGQSAVFYRGDAVLGGGRIAGASSVDAR